MKEELKEYLLNAYFNVCVSLYTDKKDEFQEGLNEGIKILIKCLFKKFIEEQENEKNNDVV